MQQLMVKLQGIIPEGFTAESGPGFTDAEDLTGGFLEHRLVICKKAQDMRCEMLHPPGHPLLGCGSHLLEPM